MKITSSLTNLLSNKEDIDNSSSRPVSPVIAPAPKRLIYLNSQPTPDKFDRKGRIIYRYPANKIHTAKYNILTFIPKNLFEQFRRLANFYFLALVVLQCLPYFGFTNPILAALPITAIVCVTAIKDAFEDFRRHRSDNEINYSTCLIANNVKNVNHVHLSMWKNLRLTIKFLFLDFSELILSFLKFRKRRRGRRNVEDGEDDGFQMAETRVSSPQRQIFSAIDQVQKSNDYVSTNPEEEDIWKSIAWCDLKVGDVIYLKNNEAIPADILILSSSETDSICYVETKNLDGETNLKIRNGFAETSWMEKPSDLHQIKCVAEVEAPNTNLYTFKGALHFPKSGNSGLIKAISANSLDRKRVSRAISMEQAVKTSTIPITVNEILLRGCVLRNTQWIIGMVLYTGAETKLIMNSGATPSKRSEIEKKTNVQVLANFLLLIILCLIIAIGSGIQYAGLLQTVTPYIPATYVDDSSQDSAFMTAFYAFWASLILLQNLVPISLYVTTELVKSFQAFFIYADVEMYYEELDAPCMPKTWTIADDLGQIEYLFSDKTGTLTRNIMEFRKCSINGVAYGGYHTTNPTTGLAGDIPNSIISAESQMIENLSQLYKNPYTSQSEITFVDQKFTRDLASLKRPQSKAIREFMTHLATCHTVLAEFPDESNEYVIKYQAQSPDEAALVATARDCGFVFLDRDQDSIMLECLGKPLKMKMLMVIEFTSSRKRMSVIVKREEDDEIILYCKGADSVIYERLAPGQDDLKEQTLEHLEEFANDGLRTLCLAKRQLTQDEYRQWLEEYQKASTSLGDREAEMEKCASRIEQSLQLLGATAIEDQLQEGVPDCIRRLSQAQIKIWVLTGDKLETAINIGFSCHLLTQAMTLIIIRGSDSVESTLQQIQEALQKFFNIQPNNDVQVEEEDVEISLDKDKVYGLIIDGQSLKFVFDPILEKKFLRLACLCKAVICCRVSPLQKAQVVDLVKREKQAITLAIGDGANDVSMIQAANVGVGILGQEGRQAVMASDYAIGQFSYLKRLLLVHGRWSYFRTAEMTLLMFYKNIIWAMIPFWFQIFCGWSSQLPFDYFFIMTYNLLFTVLPPIIIGVLDQDISATRSILAPGVYIRGIRRELYGLRLFVMYIIDGLYQSLVCFFIAYAVAGGQISASASGYSIDILHFGTLSASMAILNCNLYMGLHSLHWTWLHFLAFIGSSLLFFAATIVYSFISYSSMFGILVELIVTPYFWMALPLSVVACNLPRYLIIFIDCYLYPDDIDIIREISKYKLMDEWQQVIEYFDPPPPATVDEEELMESYDKGRQSPLEADVETLKAPLSPLELPDIHFTEPTPPPTSQQSTEPKEKDRPPSPIEVLSREIDKWLTTPVRNFTRRHKARKSTSIMYMKTGQEGTNTGFAFSQEPGLASHLSKISLQHSAIRTRKGKHRATQSMFGGSVHSTIIPVVRPKKPASRWSISGGDVFDRNNLANPSTTLYPPDFIQQMGNDDVKKKDIDDDDDDGKPSSSSNKKQI